MSDPIGLTKSMQNSSSTNPAKVLENKRLGDVIQKYEIRPEFLTGIQLLADCEIAILCDDSTSMSTALKGSNRTRWDQLKQMVNIIVDIASACDSDGVDIYFLNRRPISNVTNPKTVLSSFEQPPQGSTPIVPALRRILADKKAKDTGKKVLIIIATDGVPTNEKNEIDIARLETVLRDERIRQTYVTFIACTDDSSTLDYLSQWDKTIPNLDVIDDYAAEQAQVQKNRGADFRFSFGDYITKALLGSMQAWFDVLDDSK